MFLMLITVYLVIAVTTFNAKPDKQTCEGMEWVHHQERDFTLIDKQKALPHREKDE